MDERTSQREPKLASTNHWDDTRNDDLRSKDLKTSFSENGKNPLGEMGKPINANT